MGRSNGSRWIPSRDITRPVSQRLSQHGFNLLLQNRTPRCLQLVNGPLATELSDHLKLVI